MAAYVIVQETIHDPETFGKYAGQAPATFEPFGGKLVVRGGDPEKVEGEWPHAVVVVIEFPDRAAAKAWYDCEAYTAIRPLRHRSATSNIAIVDGV